MTDRTLAFRLGMLLGHVYNAYQRAKRAVMSSLRWVKDNWFTLFGVVMIVIGVVQAWHNDDAIMRSYWTLMAALYGFLVAGRIGMRRERRVLAEWHDSNEKWHALLKKGFEKQAEYITSLSAIKKKYQNLHKELANIKQKQLADLSAVTPGDVITVSGPPLPLTVTEVTADKVVCSPYPGASWEFDMQGNEIGGPNRVIGVEDNGGVVS